MKNKIEKAKTFKENKIKVKEVKNL